MKAQFSCLGYAPLVGAESGSDGVAWLTQV